MITEQPNEFTRIDKKLLLLPRQRFLCVNPLS